MISKAFHAIMLLDEPARREAIDHIVEGYRVLNEAVWAKSEHGAPYMFEETVVPSELYGSSVIVSTEHGQMIGTLLADTYMNGGAMAVVRAAVVYIPSSGSIVQTPLTQVRSATSEEAGALDESVRMSVKVRESEQKIVQESRIKSKGDFIEGLLQGLPYQEVGGFYRVDGPAKRTLYLSKNARRIDLTGFCIDHPLVNPISEEQAKVRKLGRVRGQALDIAVDNLTDLWVACLRGMTENV